METEAELKKLTVAQLKTKCKERRIQGYSKLAKDALIQKLLGQTSPQVPTPETSNPLPSPPAFAVDTTTTPIESSTSKDAPEPPKKKKKTSPVESSVSSSAPSASEPPKKKKKPTTSTNVPAGDADPPRPVERSTNSATVTATVQTERTSTPNPLKRPSSSVLTTDTAPPPPKKPKVPFLLPTTVPKTTLPRVVIRPPKRFIPLKVISSKNPSTSTPSIQPPAPTMTVAPAREVLFYLEFPCSLEPPTMAPVSLPPSISQRKRVPRLALILSFLVNYLERKDLDQCVLVSRMFRYAVYLSAYHHLLRHFKGDRLVQVLSKHPDASRTTNMWPYLSQRLNEVSIRKKFFVQSFLGALFPTRAISERIWMSPDHERQLIVAIRFILTRHFFKVSIGDGKLQGGPGWREGQIIDAQQLVPNQVWKITISHSRKETESFFVLEQTCEPLAAPTGSQNSGFSVRVDWSAYITECTQSNHSSIQPLITRLNWTNHEEYDRGISRLWLKRMDEAGKMGFVKRLTAERYILACVVGNSLSGRWMSSTQMALEHRGLPEEVAIAKPTVNFFLPAHHHVESVHFTATGPRKGQLLHGALAVIQTPGREYFILRDNGMQVGCEEDGVAEVWMKMLRCDSWGVALD
ncbi:hypothetical protein C8F01DRAFT_1016100 [Mycena amicta]|nr:hypothetical protein C8F01DRAFT_1016100 [Mycena amicta]